MMVLNPVDLFEKCIFPTNKNKPNVLKEKTEEPENEILGISMETKKHADLDDQNLTLQSKSEYTPIQINDHFLEGDDSLERKNLDIIIDKNDFCEIDLEVPKDEEVLLLKNRNEVYFEMYREAKKKARMARDFALSAYLEAKRIKNTYLLDEAFDSDDEKEEEKSLENMKI